jgi:hypothetical protein
MLFCMQSSTSVRIDRRTHDELKELATELHLSVGETVRYAVRRLHQRQFGEQLAAEPTSDESAWLDADLG